MRSGSVTLLVAAALVAAVLGAGWTLQAASLPAPVRGELVAAGAISWLARDRYVTSAFSIGGEPATRAQCREGWFPVDTRRKEPGTVLHFGRHAIVAAIAGHRLMVHGVPHGGGLLAAVQLQLAGCTRLLARTIATALYSGHGIRIERADVADRPAIAIALPLKQSGDLRVYVTPRAFRPIALSLRDLRFDGRSRIRLRHLTPALAAAFDGRA